MAATQRGIPRPRRTKADLDLREAVLEAIARLQKHRTLSALASELGISAKTLSRYRNPESSATLGGDILFRVCELCDNENISVSCRGRILRLRHQDVFGTSEGSPPEQLRFRFMGTFDLALPNRKSVMKIDSVTADDNAKTG